MHSLCGGGNTDQVFHLQTPSHENLCVIPQALVEDNNDGILLLCPEIQSQDLGLGKAEGQSYDVDIIAVHGLGGHRLKTWTSQDGILWLRDWLPRSLPGARVYTYGYASKVAFSKSILGINDFARDLLENTRAVRQGKVCFHHDPVESRLI